MGRKTLAALLAVVSVGAWVALASRPGLWPTVAWAAWAGLDLLVRPVVYALPATH